MCSRELPPPTSSAVKPPPKEVLVGHPENIDPVLFQKSTDTRDRIIFELQINVEPPPPSADQT